MNSYGAKKEQRSGNEGGQPGWEIDARKKYGKDWAEWDNATGTDIDCHKVSGGHQCIAVGTPCMAK